MDRFTITWLHKARRRVEQPLQRFDAGVSVAVPKFRERCCCECDLRQRQQSLIDEPFKASGIALAAMRLYALVEAGDPEAIDVYLCEQDAQQALEECLRDQPNWHGLLRVEEVELDHEHTSLN